MTFNLRISDDVDYKIKHIAKLEQRSKNKQIEFILLKFIEIYEDEHGKIEIKEDEEQWLKIYLKH